MSGLAELRSIVGDAGARDAGEEDSVDGIRPRFVAEPASAEEASELLRLAGRSGWRVAPRGGGSKLGRGNPPEALDLIVSTTRLSRLVEHAAGDLVVTAEAGLPLAALQAELARAGQMLALDPPEPAATVGGVIAANASGPRRLRYGTVRDLLIGITVVLADGTVARAGGKVVKNVAGYDLGKLFTGSLGTLGLIVQATFRLHPHLAADGLVEVELSSATAAGVALQRLLHSALVPAAAELAWGAAGNGRMLVRFEGTAAGVEAQATAAVALLQPTGRARALPEEEAATRWREVAAPLWSGEVVGLKVSSLPAELPRVLETILAAAARLGPGARLSGQVGNGILQVALPGGRAETVAGVVREIREGIGEGSVTVLHAPLELKRHVDVWGPVGDALPLMRRVKEEFDPARMLNPGRFVGGI